MSCGDLRGAYPSKEIEEANGSRTLESPWAAPVRQLRRTPPSLGEAVIVVDVAGVLSAPWMQPLIGAIVTAVGAWWGSKRSGEADHGGITQLAETHGAKSPVHQTASLVVNRHTWQVQAREPQPRRLSAPAQSSSSESDDLWWVIILIGIIAIIALTWVLAAFWPTVSTILYVLVLIAIFIAALTWHRWPDGIAGRVAVRTAIVTVGSAVLWAVSVLPQPVRGEPALPTIAASTEGLPFGQALGKTLNLIGMNGLFTYELRLFGRAFSCLPSDWLPPRRSAWSSRNWARAGQTPPRALSDWATPCPDE